jgi:hypothetical protein
MKTEGVCLMATPFDIITVIAFLGLVATFFLWTDRDTRTLLHFLVSSCALAVANQVGNAGGTVFAVVLIVAGLGYAALISWRAAS